MRRRETEIRWDPERRMSLTQLLSSRTQSVMMQEEHRS